MNKVRVVLPHHLRNLAQVGQEVQLEVDGLVSVSSVLDALETGYPMLKGTIRDHGTLKRRAFLRFFACGEDISLESPDLPLPLSIQEGRDPLMVIGAIAGG
jgi:sulfur-carrier protein